MADKHRNCLIVENNILIGLDLAETLRALGFASCDHAKDQNAADAMLAAEQYDLAFIDCGLEQEQVEELALRLKSQGTAVILTSTTVDRAELPAALSTLPLLSKPYSMEAVKALLD